MVFQFKVGVCEVFVYEAEDSVHLLSLMVCVQVFDYDWNVVNLKNERSFFF